MALCVLQARERDSRVHVRTVQLVLDRRAYVRRDGRESSAKMVRHQRGAVTPMTKHTSVATSVGLHQSNSIILLSLVDAKKNAEASIQEYIYYCAKPPIYAELQPPFWKLIAFGTLCDYCHKISRRSIICMKNSIRRCICKYTLRGDYHFEVT